MRSSGYCGRLSKGIGVAMESSCIIDNEASGCYGIVGNEAASCHDIMGNEAAGFDDIIGNEATGCHGKGRTRRVEKRNM
ncbi:hypothetical protein V6N12_042583 [Hibiscus sabdariffa]|uniref:Right handed beta helix domain-containing protein n=1 Tax=Hibiscus sabdariffa TaxID=183260 RepID=A0ABR2EFM7_9ROSI